MHLEIQRLSPQNNRGNDRRGNQQTGRDREKILYLEIKKVSFSIPSVTDTNLPSSPPQIVLAPKTFLCSCERRFLGWHVIAKKSTCRDSESSLSFLEHVGKSWGAALQKWWHYRAGNKLKWEVMGGFDEYWAFALYFLHMQIVHFFRIKDQHSFQTPEGRDVMRRYCLLWTGKVRDGVLTIGS